MRNKSTPVLFLCATLLAANAYAESASDSLSRIEAETLVLKAREKQLEVQSNIIAKQNDIMARQRMADQLTQTAGAGDPLIRSVEGVGKTMFATLQLNDGSVVDAQAGQVLSNGMKVVSIRLGEVIVETGKKRRIRLASAAAVQPATATMFNASYPTPNLPILPPLPPAAPRGPAK